MADDQTPQLVEAVSQLTSSVRRLDKLLRDEYPKKSELRENYVSKLENQKVITKVILVALIAVLGCYVTTVGAYSQCFVGNESPGVCQYVPGYEDRIDRRDEIDQRFDDLEKIIEKQQRQLQGGN